MFIGIKRGKNNKKLRVILACVAVFLLTACSSNPSNLDSSKDHFSSKEKPFKNHINQENIYVGTQFNAKEFTVSNSDVQVGKTFYVLIQASDEDKMFEKAHYYYTINKMIGKTQTEIERQRIIGYRADGKRENVSIVFEKGNYNINLFRDGKIVKTRHFSVK